MTQQAIGEQISIARGPSAQNQRYSQRSGAESRKPDAAAIAITCDVAGLLAVDGRAHELGEPVRTPAERVQAPEQEAAVSAQEVDIHRDNLFKIHRARATARPARSTAGRRNPGDCP